MASIIKAITKYLPDKRVLDERQNFDELAKPLFHKGNEIGCITLHGIGGTPANIRAVAEPLINCGYTVYAPMLPGHGETVRQLNASTGEQWLACVLEAYDRLKAEGCTQILAFGLSLGGILAGLVAERRELKGLMMICAPVKTQAYLSVARVISPILPFVRYPRDEDEEDSWRKNPYAQMYDGFSTIKLKDLARLTRHLKKDLDKIACPVFVLQARYDDKVDPASVDILRKGLTAAAPLDFLTLDNSPHGCTYGPERELVGSLAADFAARVVDKPNGA